VNSPIVRGALALLALGIAAAAVIPVVFRPPELPVVRLAGSNPGAPDPVPWREPEADLRRFFAGADRHREEVRILSRERETLIRRLGRQPTGEEHLAVLHRVLAGDRPIGTVMVRRVPGTGGSIEVVIAVSPQGKVRGIRLQRQREPAEVAELLESRRWLSAFEGRTAEGGWQVDSGLLEVPEQAREPARAIAEGVRSALIVLEVAEAKGLPAGPEAHH